MEDKKDMWRWIINLVASVLTALAAALGTTSCISNLNSTPASVEYSGILAHEGPRADAARDIKMRKHGAEGRAAFSFLWWLRSRPWGEPQGTGTGLAGLRRGRGEEGLGH